MINKTMRQNAEVAIGVAEVMRMNPRLKKESEVFSYAYHLIATDILTNHNSVDWASLAMIDFKDREADIEFADTRAVSIEENDYKTVLEHFQEQPGVNRVQFAYLTRLVLLYSRKKLRDLNGDNKVEIEKLDGVELLRRVNEKAAELIQNGNVKEILVFLQDI